MVLCEMFGSKGEQVTGDCMKLHNHEFYDLLLSNVIRVIISRRKRLAGHVAHLGERRNAYRVLVGKPESKTPP